MKKIMTLVILLMVGLMVACTTEPNLPRLATPTGIVVNKNVISFSPVEGAEKYVVNVNSVNTTISFTQYTITESGTYQVQIKAIGKNYRDSLYTTPTQVVVGYLNYPTDIHILNNIVNFTAIPNTNSYNIEIDGIVYNTAENPPVQLAPGTYAVRVQALSNTFINSLYSPIIQLTVEGSQDLDKLQTPDGIVVNKNHISFNDVDGADHYVISLNSNGIVITDTEYTVTEPGTYEVLVKATGVGYADSDFSSTYNMIVGYLVYPSVVEINQGMILFAEVENADSYNVEVNGLIVNTTLNSIAITEPGNYAVRLQSISSVYVDSPFSPIINLVVEDPIIQSEHTYTYSQISEFDLPLYMYPGGPIEDINFSLVGGTIEVPTYTPIDPENLALIGNSVYLKAAYLDSLTPQVDPYAFILESNIGYHQIKIRINQAATPYVYSDQRVHVNMLTDVVFRFETFGATFSSLSAPTDAPITTDEYSFSEGVLTIKNSYIKRTFEQNPSRTDIIFLFLFNNQGILNIAPISVAK